MPVFEYRGLSATGKQVTGLLEADSSKALRTQLRKEDVFLTDVLGQSEARTGRKAAADREVHVTRLFRGRISTEDIAIITRQLATLLRAGVTLVERLAALVDQAEKDRLKRILSDVKQRVNEGSSLADALGQHPKIFGNLYVNMVRAGEASGALDAVLARLADFTEGQAKLKQKVIGTLIYPAIMIVIGGGILVMLMTVVVPKVTRIFETCRPPSPGPPGC